MHPAAAQGSGRAGQIVGAPGSVALPVIEDITFRGGVADDDVGGALSILDTAAEFRRCSFRGNAATYGGLGGSGGAVAITADADVSFVDCEFVNNRAVWGGAIYTEQGTNLTIVSSQLLVRLDVGYLVSAASRCRCFVSGLTCADLQERGVWVYWWPARG